jgi:predicted RNA binding protein YcfA (HicA-like mRNA interferase family)
MPKLPVVSGVETIRALQRLGFIVIRQKGCVKVRKVVLFPIIVK